MQAHIDLWYHMFGANMGDLYIETAPGQSAAAATAWGTPPPPGGAVLTPVDMTDNFDNGQLDPSLLMFDPSVRPWTASSGATNPHLILTQSGSSSGASSSPHPHLILTSSSPRPHPILRRDAFLGHWRGLGARRLAVYVHRGLFSNRYRLHHRAGVSSQAMFCRCASGRRIALI